MVIVDEFALNGIHFAARFQPYHDLKPIVSDTDSAPDKAELFGELLTQPLGIDISLEIFFASLSIEDSLKILSWQLKISEQLFSSLNIRTAINIHNSIIDQESDRIKFLDTIHASNAPVTFEFTETFAMPEKGITNHLLREIRKMGHSTALDDFGTGLNGMSLLTDCDFDIIKLDRSLTSEIVAKPEKVNTISLILRMLNILGRDHIVEGVEDSAVYENLVDIGFSRFQGYLFERPMDLKELDENSKKILNWSL